MSLYTLDVTPFVSILAEAIADRSSGRITVIHHGVRRDVFMAHGEVVLVISSDPAESLGQYLLDKGMIGPLERAALVPATPTGIVPHFHEGGVSSIGNKDQRLREWETSLCTTLFSLAEGNAAFTDEEAIAPEQRVLLLSTPSLVLTGVRSIENGLILRKAIGDTSRMIAPGRDQFYARSMLPLNETERKIAEAITQPVPLATVLRQPGVASVTMTRTIIALLTLGVIEVAEASARVVTDSYQVDRDLSLMAQIGSADARSLRAIALARKLEKINLYELLEVPRAASRTQIMARLEELRMAYAPKGFPALISEQITAINRKLEQATNLLLDPTRRHQYDLLLQEAATDDRHVSMEQRIARRTLANRNFQRAQELAAEEDYYGAIVLLRQTVNFSPDNAEAWFLLASCQQKNPKWLRDASDSYRQVLVLDPNHTDALLSLGDLYKAQGLTSRAESCYEEVLQIAPKHPEAVSRLKSLR